MPKQNRAEEPKPATIEELQSQVNDLTKKARELKDEVFRLRVERDVLERAAEVKKKEEVVSLGNLTNRDKSVVIDALRNRYRLKTLLSVLQMSKSSYFYQESAMAAPDKYADVREKIRQAFDESSNQYSYRRIHAALRNESMTVSDFDGLPVAWTIGTSPNADLVNQMLDAALEALKPGEYPIVHSDR